MALKTAKREKARAVTTTGIRTDDLERLQQMARDNRLINVEAISAMLDAWETLTAEQQVQVIRRQGVDESVPAK